MIFGKTSGIHNVGRILDVLGKAQKGVVRINLDSKWLCTGFFIDRDLVVTSAFMFEEQKPRPDNAFVERYRNGKLVQTFPVKSIELLPPDEIIPARWMSEREMLLALLRVAAPRSRATKSENDGVMELGFDVPQPGQFVAVVQIPATRQDHGISFGTVSSASSDGQLSYDADTDFGGAGAPVLDASWHVMGMHFASNSEKRLNEGITRAALVASLRHSKSWKKIKVRHNLADVAAAAAVSAEPMVATPAEPPKPASLLIRVALSAEIDPGKLTDEEKELLFPHVADPSADKWVLSPADRANLIRAGGSLAELRKLAPKVPPARKNAQQKVIDRILKGPPYDLHGEDETSLSWWIQASRWFAGVDPKIPSPAEVTRVLERRRVRSRLAVVAGTDFRGRKTELANLDHWWRMSKKPLSLTGIGGIGKSALIARFASRLPEDTLLLWLDFDRADLAPDDAGSVLSAIARQAEVQLENFEAPAFEAEQWQQAAKELGKRIRGALPSDAKPLLVLDSFEAAQYAKRYQELWPVLQEIAKTLPRLRLVVTGRAHVPNLRLRGQAAEAIHLVGLKREDARAWLRDHGVKDKTVLERVLDLANGIPLILRLALLLLERGGKVKDLPTKLPDEIKAGFLYGRILDRVQNPRFKRVAAAALVLRRLSANMVERVLRGLVELPSGEVSSWFPDLAREMALFEAQGTDVLRLRAEVRVPTLELLEKDQPDFVKAVDIAAVQWYATEDTTNREIAAELVYHCLRLGDEAAATKAWRDDSRKLFEDVGKDLSEPARQWLRRHGVVLAAEGDVILTEAEWEFDASDRIRSARSRGHGRVVKDILGERSGRTDASPLVFQEAFERWAGGDLSGAANLLDAAGDAPDLIGRNRRVLRALLFAQAKNSREADNLLSTVEAIPAWVDRRSPMISALAIRAARINATLDFSTELRMIDMAAAAADAGLEPVHVVLPRLREALVRDEVVVESARPVMQLNIEYRSQVEAFVDSIPTDPDHTAGPQGVLSLIHMAAYRWRLAVPFLKNAYDVATGAEPSELVKGIVGSLALFASRPTHRNSAVNELVGYGGPIWAAVQQHGSWFRALRPESRWHTVYPILYKGVDPEIERYAVDSFPALAFRLPPEERNIVIHLLSPDPLEQLVRELAGFTN